MWREFRLLIPAQSDVKVVSSYVTVTPEYRAAGETRIDDTAASRSNCGEYRRSLGTQQIRYLYVFRRRNNEVLRASVNRQR